MLIVDIVGFWFLVQFCCNLLFRVTSFCLFVEDIVMSVWTVDSIKNDTSVFWFAITIARLGSDCGRSLLVGVGMDRYCVYYSNQTVGGLISKSLVYCMTSPLAV